ncbi:MAG: hypothetical protein E7416_00085 [Ruminococcaceae bacterium]|nr:hypothetical protein [Oscillospiraceae bacterium]
MNLNGLMLSSDEKAVFSLRNLYTSYGYTKYRMSKFEEYDFYVRNKGFLISDNIITFTDSDGKLMALKPDVTLSIIKNSKDSVSGVQKLYYNENVYRQSGDMHEIKEIMQTGLECVGDIDSYNICETVLLAALSLACISDDYVLDISHMDIVSEAMDYAKISTEARRQLLSALGEKNLQRVTAICRDEGVGEAAENLLTSLVTLYGGEDAVIPQLKELAVSDRFNDAIALMEDIFKILKDYGCADKVHIDFSVVNNMNYYNGIAFNGFINGIHGSVLSGGQYDLLMRKMGKSSGAIGFAVYLDMLGTLEDDKSTSVTEAVIIYGDDCSAADISRAVKELSATYTSVVAEKSIPEKMRYKNLFILGKNGLKEAERDA